ncbi:MAG: MFS transporter, partial [Planctomycetaceae bacterium]
MTTATGSHASPPGTLTRTGRYLILAAAFLGWLFSGVQMSLMNLASRPATEDFLRSGRLPIADTPAAELTPAVLKQALKREAPGWFSYHNSSFLLGAALGGLVFGWLGDRAGRVRAMGLSILCYSVVAGLTYWVQDPWHLLVLRFLAAMGVGGMWPTGVALAAEAWDDVSRPFLSGLIGTAANVGIVAMGIVGYIIPITADSWRWIFLVAAAPVCLGFAVLLVVPESPTWLAARDKRARGGTGQPAILR